MVVGLHRWLVVLRGTRVLGGEWWYCFLLFKRLCYVGCCYGWCMIVEMVV